MSRDMPQRPANHVQETWSSRAFALALPPQWLIHSQVGDYGIDHRVEIFEDGRATGLEFNVQLKSSRTGSGQSPAKAIKRSTLNYWRALASPTLIIIAHAPSESLWFEWAHLLPWERDPTTMSRLVRCESVLSRDSAAGLAIEVTAFRQARSLSHHLPIDVAISGDRFYDQSSSPVRSAIARALSSLPSFMSVVHGAPRTPHFHVEFENERVMVSLQGGSRGRQLTWDFPGERDFQMIAADIVAALAFEAGNVGADDLFVRLLKLAAPRSQMLLSALGFGAAVSILIKHDEATALLELARRTICIERSPAAPAAFAALMAHASIASAPIRQSLSFELSEAARRWERPATGLYNASGLLGSVDARGALRLLEEAGEADDLYQNRSYWWRERGALHWSLSEVNEAEMCYLEAVRLGDVSAQFYLADLEMRTGRFDDALRRFELADLDEHSNLAQWRLSRVAVKFLSQELGIVHQTRDAFSYPAFTPDTASELAPQAFAAIREDALNGYAHWTLSRPQNSGVVAEHILGHAVTAAISINTNPLLWLDLLTTLMFQNDLPAEENLNLSHDAMVCAYRYCGAAFVDAVFEEQSLHPDLREAIVNFFELVRPQAEPVTLRFHDEDGSKEVEIPRS